MTTSGAATVSQGDLNQPMPAQVADSSGAAGRFVPPADVGNAGQRQVASNPVAPDRSASNSVRSQDLPVLARAAGSPAKMSAQSSAKPVSVASSSAPSPATAHAVAAAHASGDAYVHTIESGESLYSIAKRYNVTTDAIMAANKLTSPNELFVGQKLVIPGRPDLAGPKKSERKPTLVAEAKPVSPVATDAAPAPVVPMPKPDLPQQHASVQKTTGHAKPDNAEPQKSAAKPAENTKQPTSEVKTASLSPKAPKASQADNFRWPVSGRVIVDFAASKGTGINIEAPEGSMVRAVDNGTVIYVGDAVEGYGNLILIRHPNGYVSAYAHLKSVSATKGEEVQRGDPIGTVGMTGAVSRPQLHFELRKGATPVDPTPLLAQRQ